MHPRTIRPLGPALAGALLVGWTGAGCRGSAPPESAPSPVLADECVLRAGDSVRAGDVLVVLQGPRDSLLLAAQRVDQLVRFDCLGRLRPGLATAWSSDATGRTWTLTLPDAGAVARAWRDRPEATAGLRWSGVESVVPIDDRRLVVTFGRPRDSLPALFADRALGLAREDTTVPRLRPMPGTRDARDAIDHGADLILTADPAALDYAAGRGDMTIHPLPWDRTYVLVVPGGGPGLGAVPGTDTAGFRAALAASAVRVEARGAEGPLWWETADCPTTDAAVAAEPIASAGSPAVRYLSDDSVARALAERLVAMSEVPGTVARPIEPSGLAAALRAGSDRAYVVALPRRALVPCREISDWPPGAMAVALVDTRATLILRDGVPPLEVDFEGAVRPAEPR